MGRPASTGDQARAEEVLPEVIAAQLKEHQTVLVDWPFAEPAQELHRWVEIFDVEFKLQLPAYPILQFERLRHGTFGTYAWFRNAVGTRDNITFNIRHLQRQPADVLATLLHELIHLWQHYHGTPGKRNYHNVQFRAKARACGLIVAPEGWHLGVTEAFTTVLDKHGVAADPFFVALTRLQSTAPLPTKMRKWRCRCTTVRCATDLKALCKRCEHPFCQES